jgi:hypothetical protein
MEFDGIGAEVGIFFALSLFGVLVVLDKLSGRVFRVKTFLLNRSFDSVKDPRILKCLTVTIRMTAWLAVILPVLALFVWTAALIAQSRLAGNKGGGGICVLMLGCSLLCFLGNIARMRWNHHEFDWLNGVYFVMTFFFLTAYQFVAVYIPGTKTTFGVSVVFLSLNCLIMMFLVFVNSAVRDCSIEDIVNKRLQTAQQAGQPVPDPTRKGDFQSETKNERDNKQFHPSQEDVFDIFTIGREKHRRGFIGTAFGSGVQNFFAGLRPIVKRSVQLFLWCLSVAVLIVYSYQMKSLFPTQKALGFITMIAIVTTDFLVFLIQNAQIMKTATPMCFSLILNRLLLIIFGGDHWVYGYVLIYLFYGILLSYIIAKKRFPLEDGISEEEFEKATSSSTAKKAVAPTAQGVDAKVEALEEKAEAKLAFSRQPEVPLAAITIIYIIILLILTLVKPDQIPLPRLQVS